MAYYHCSPTAKLTILEPGKPKSFKKAKGVYLTTLLPMALMYSIRNFEYTYGYTANGQIYYEEYFPNALEILYKNKAASLYLCSPVNVSTTEIPNEAISDAAVPVISETRIPDAYEALLEQERLGTLIIRRYAELSPKRLEWIRKAEADEIHRHDLLHTGGPMADYIKQHYPDSWAMAEAEEQTLLHHGTFASGLHTLKPLSQLHNSDQNVVYLSSSIPYVLLYIWDCSKTQYSRKWVTGWQSGGITYYEEQFPGQLEAFYKGVHGYVYDIRPCDGIQPVPQREDMFYSVQPLSVYRINEIADVYQELLRYEEQGIFKLLRFEEASAEKQAELTDRIATYIDQNNLLNQNNETSRFMKRYYRQAWNKAKNEGSPASCFG